MRETYPNSLSGNSQADAPAWTLIAAASILAVPLTLGLVVVGSQISPWVALGATVGIFACLAMVLSPTSGLIAVALSLPLERIGRLTEDFSSFTISLSRIVGLIALGGLLTHVLLNHRRLRFGLAFWIYAGYTAVALMGVTWALQEKDALRDGQRILGNLLFFLLIINLVTRYDLVRLAITVWLLASAGSTVYGVYQYHFGASIEENQMGATSERFSGVVSDDAETANLGVRVKRAYGTTSHPGLFGLNLAMTIPFFAWIMHGRRDLVKLFWFTMFCLCCYGIVLSNTRFTFIIAGIMLALTLVRGLWDFRPMTFAALALAGAMAVPFIPSDIYLRGFDPSLYSADKSTTIRIRFKMLDKSLDLLADHWLLGIGVGNQDIIPAMITDELGGRITPDGVKASAHNEFVWSMVEVGIFGWLLHWAFVVLIVAASFLAGSRLKRMPGEEEQYRFLVAAQILLACVPLYGLQSEVFHYPLKGWWFVAGIVWVIWSAVRKQPVGGLVPVVEGVEETQLA